VGVVGYSMFMYSMVVAAVIPDPLNPEIEIKFKTSIITIAGESSRCYMEIPKSSQILRHLYGLFRILGRKRTQFLYKGDYTWMNL
jgi:hypothetical protein